MKDCAALQRPRQRRLFSISVATILCAGLTWTASSADPKTPVDSDHAAKMAKGLDLFKKHVRPVLVQRCVRCHGGKEVESQFDLTEREGLLRGGKAGPAILVGKSKESLLYQLITHAREPHMPFESKKLPDDTIASIAAWIDNGAPY